MEPQIQHITFDEILEFKDLDMHKLAQEANTVWAIVYDPITRKYIKSKLYDGYSMTIYKAELSQAYVTNTDKLSVERGFIFESGSSLDDVVRALTNPPAKPKVTISISNRMVEASVSTSLNISFSPFQGDGCPIDATSAIFYVDNVDIGGTGSFDLLRTTEQTVNVRMIVSTVSCSGASYNDPTLSDSTFVRVVYPHFIGFKAVLTGGGHLPITSSDLSSREDLEDVTLTKRIIIDFNTLGVSGASYLYFATHTSHAPKSWVEISASGVEDGINKGDIDVLFDKLPSAVSHKGNDYNIYITKQPTEFAKRIKIKF